MPHCSFYALRDDIEAVFDFVTQEMGLRVFECYSPPGSELREFHTFSELTAAYEVGIGQRSAHLMLFSSTMGGTYLVRRFALEPKVFPQRPWRETIEGWGLIALYFGGLKRGSIHPSDTSHNSEKRALAWESTYLDTLGSTSVWEWKEVSRISRKLNYHIQHRLAVSKAGSRSVLSAAFVAMNSEKLALAPI